MSSNDFPRYNRLSNLIGLAILVLPAHVLALSIHVTYPKPGQIVTATDSTFILGHLEDDSMANFSDIRLRVNGALISVHKDGGFIAFVPVTAGDFVFNIVATKAKQFASKVESNLNNFAKAEIIVSIPKPLQTLPYDRLQIISGYGDPRGDLSLAAGDRLLVQFRGTPGASGWFSIPGVIDSVPMSESEPQLQLYWGESVFGAGNVPDSVKLGGIYSGFYSVQSGTVVEDVHVIYHLAPPDKSLSFLKYLQVSDEEVASRLFASLLLDSLATVESAYRISLNSPQFPVTVRFTDSMQTIRHLPRKGYFSIFQSAGVEAMAVSSEADWFRLKLSPTQFAWANAASVELLPKGIVPPHSLVRIIRTYGFDDSVVVEIPLSGKHPFRVYEDDKRTLRIQLFGVTTDTDWIRYDFDEPLIDVATWSQPEVDFYEITLKLTQDIWGYESNYLGNSFRLTLNKPPDKVHSLKGKKIVVDAGHSGDPGSIGPTGLTEAEANLGIALALAKQLRRKGAQVTLTRNDNSHVALYERPSIARSVDADLFLSIHNNALPDGVNPFTNNGVSTYYYHPHSMDLARAIQSELIPATGLRDHGLYHGNLAVNRPTQYPAVLIECAFMLMPEQEANLKTERYRNKVAKGIVKGVEKFLKGYNSER